MYQSRFNNTPRSENRNAFRPHSSIIESKRAQNACRLGIRLHERAPNSFFPWKTSLLHDPNRLEKIPRNASDRPRTPRRNRQDRARSSPPDRSEIRSRGPDPTPRRVEKKIAGPRPNSLGLVPIESKITRGAASIATKNRPSAARFGEIERRIDRLKRSDISPANIKAVEHSKALLKLNAPQFIKRSIRRDPKRIDRSSESPADLAVFQRFFADFTGKAPRGGERLRAIKHAERIASQAEKSRRERESLPHYVRICEDRGRGMRENT